MPNQRTNVRNRVMICCATKPGINCMDIHSTSERFKIDKIQCFIPKPSIMMDRMPRSINRRIEDGTTESPDEVPAGLMVKKTFGYELTPEERDVLDGKSGLEREELWNYQNEHGIRYELKGMEFIEDSNIFNLDEMMRRLNETIESEKRKQSILYMSITNGTPEYIAAASILAMMNEIPLIGRNDNSRMKDTDEEQTDDTISEKERKQRYKNRYIEIKPIKIDKPDELELKCLKVFNSFDEPTERSNNNVIRKLIWTGLWNQKKTGNKDIKVKDRTKGTSLEGKYYSPDLFDKDKKPDPKNKVTINNKEALRYHRHYIRRWYEEEKWIESIKYTDKYRVKPEAERLIKIFCSDAIFDVQKELDKMRDPEANKESTEQPVENIVEENTSNNTES